MQNRTRITKQVMKAYYTLNVYGRQPEALEYIVESFAEQLVDYEIEEIERAFSKWASTNKEFPTPADIISKLSGDGDYFEKRARQQTRLIKQMKADGRIETPPPTPQIEYKKEYADPKEVAALLENFSSKFKTTEIS